MTKQLDDLRAALDDVPGVMLDDALVRGVADAKAAVDALDQLRAEPTIIVVSGASGSGKSTIVNALVGEEVSVVSPIRPTTTAITAIGPDDLVPIEGVTKVVVSDALPSGVVVVDTPPWDRASAPIKDVIARSALTIVVVTPARYGDDATHENIAAAAASGAVQLIANRLPVGDGQREQVEDAMHERLDIRPLASFSEGDQIHFDVSPLQGIRPSMEGNSTRRVLRKAAAATSRRIATAITAGANQIGEVEQALADTAEPQVGFGSIGTSTWEQARTELLRASVDLADGYDMSVERSAGNDLAVRIRRSLGPLDSAGIADELDEWRTRATQSMVDVARFGLRRTSGLRIVEQHAWIAAVNGDFARPKRFDKMVRSAGNEITSKARSDLIEILESPAKSRRDQWHGTLQDIGSFRPGELLVAADAVFQSEAGDG